MTSGFEPPPLPGVAGGYFDGRQSIRRPVRVRIEHGHVVLDGPTGTRAPLSEVEIADAAGGAPASLRFPGGGYCEIDSREAFLALLAPHGLTPGRVSQWEGSPRWVLVAVAVFALTLVAAYRWGIPLAARVVATQVPTGVVDVLSAQVLSTLDTTVFNPSVSPIERRNGLVARFNAMRMPDADRRVSYSIEFRSSQTIGANAMALPNGTIVVTDGLLDLTSNDEEILAVLGHEAGHVVERHGLRQMFQSSVVALLVTWFIGDINMLVAAAPTALLQAKYSRDFERDADDYAIEVMRANDVPLTRMADMLERLDAAAREQGGGASVTVDLDGYLSSHPVTRERIGRLRGR